MTIKNVLTDRLMGEKLTRQILSSSDNVAEEVASVTKWKR